MTPERVGTMVLLACHGVFDVALNHLYAEFPEDRPVYEAQLAYAAKHVIWRKAVDPFLIISGAPTKSELSCSESRSYWEWAGTEKVALPHELGLEEFGLTSIENLLLSLYVYHMKRKRYPQQIDVISWNFKSDRFMKTLEAIGKWSPFGESWTSLNFFPVGDLPTPMRQKAETIETAYIASLEDGLDAYYSNPITKERIRQRDVHQSRSRARNFYSAYPLPFEAA